MKVVLQRVKKASVEVEGKTVGNINQGICLLVGIEKGDSGEDARYLAGKISELRIFPDKEKKMNLSLLDVKGEVLAVSQFTLAGSLKKGRRPSFDNAEDPIKAKHLFNEFVEYLRSKGLNVETGIFAAVMDVHLVNDGPVTFIIESKRPD
jgi:D-tyrosyl-tRNA(Tyr) deacylase